MRYAIISDIHSNLQAFQSVLRIFDSKNIDEIVCLGDIVGYNANPSECIKVARENPKIKNVVIGNHDEDAAKFDRLSYSDLMSLHPDAIAGLKYSSLNTSEEEKKWLLSLPSYIEIKGKKIKFAVTHLSPFGFGYILNEGDVKLNMTGWFFSREKRKPNLFFFGHSHLPTYISFSKESQGVGFEFDMGRHLDADTYLIDKKKVYFINPGSVGQPRSGITSYAIFDTLEKSVRIESFEYDWGMAQKAVNEAGYSQNIANRLNPNYGD